MFVRCDTLTAADSEMTRTETASREGRTKKGYRELGAGGQGLLGAVLWGGQRDHASQGALDVSLAHRLGEESSAIYLANIYHEIKKRPLYIVESVQRF